MLHGHHISLLLLINTLDSRGVNATCIFRRGFCTLVLPIASTNFSVFALRVLAYTNFSDFLCLHNVIMNTTKVGRIHMQVLDAGITPCIVSHLNSKCQGPTHIRYIHYTRLYILRMRVRVPRSRVGPRLYLACFTPVAPVASL